MSSTRRTNILNVLSYVSVICVGLALLVAWILGFVKSASTVASALTIIAECLAYIVVACYSFSYARAKGIWWLIAWVVAVVLIVVFKILNIF